MSLENLLGKSNAELKEMPQEEMLDAFQEQISDRNIAYTTPEKMSLVGPAIVGTSLGFLTYFLTKSRRTT